MESIRTPLLRTFIAYYGNAGYQFFNVDFGSLKKCLNLGLNISIFCAISLHSSLNDPWKTKTIEHWTTVQSPFVGLIAGNLTKLVCPFLLQCVMLYYFFKGRRIIELLDNDHYFQVYQYVSPKLLVPCLAVLFLISWLINPNKVTLYSSNDYVWFVLNWAVVILQVTSFYNNYFILHYYQYGNRCCLELIEKELADEKVFNERKFKRTLFHSIRHLATLSQQLTSVMSVPLLLSLSITLLSNVSIVCIALVLDTDDLGTFLYLNILFNFFGYLYLVYLATLNRQVVTTFERLITSKQFTLCDQPPLLGSSAIEAELYSHCFTLRLFGLTVLNLETLFSAALFCICLAVFIFQTK